MFGGRVNMSHDIYTIAVIDDDDNICRTLKAMIETSSSKYRVVCANDGKSGLAMIARARPDMIILDVHMPKMSGMEVLKKVKQGYWCVNVPVVMLSGDDSEECVDNSMYSYAEAHLVKPCSRQMIMSVIERNLSLVTPMRNEAC